MIAQIYGLYLHVGSVGRSALLVLKYVPSLGINYTYPVALLAHKILMLMYTCDLSIQNNTYVFALLAGPHY
jgi:hypothetical protein